MRSLERRLKKSERAAARRRVADALARAAAAVESMSDDELAAWWYGMAQHADHALEGRFEHFDEPARSGVKAWGESGVVEALKADAAEYESGLLPESEVPDTGVVLPPDRVERLRDKTVRLAREHGEPVQRDPDHEAYVAA